MTAVPSYLRSAVAEVNTTGIVDRSHIKKNIAKLLSGKPSINFRYFNDYFDHIKDFLEKYLNHFFWS